MSSKECVIERGVVKIGLADDGVDLLIGPNIARLGNLNLVMELVSSNFNDVVVMMNLNMALKDLEDSCGSYKALAEKAHELGLKKEAYHYFSVNSQISSHLSEISSIRKIARGISLGGIASEQRKQIADLEQSVEAYKDALERCFSGLESVLAAVRSGDQRRDVEVEIYNLLHWLGSALSVDNEDRQKIEGASVQDDTGEPEDEPIIVTGDDIVAAESFEVEVTSEEVPKSMRQRGQGHSVNRENVERGDE